MRWALPGALVAAFLLGSTLAGSAVDRGEFVEELRNHQGMLFEDLAKIEQALKDIREIRQTREAGRYVLNEEEKKLEKQAHQDMHIFMERARNDTLQVLQMYDRVLAKQDYIDPIEKKFGKALREIVEVAWDEEPLEDIVAQINGGYGVPIYVSGEIDARKTMSLEGQVTLLAILLQIENVFDAQLVERDGELWFVGLGAKTD